MIEIRIGEMSCVRSLDIPLISFPKLERVKIRRRDSTLIKLLNFFIIENAVLIFDLTVQHITVGETLTKE